MPILRVGYFWPAAVQLPRCPVAFSLIGVRFAADAALEGDGFELPVPLTEARDILVLVAKFKILSRSTRCSSASLSRLETSHEPGDFFIEALLRILQIDRGINALLAVRHGPAHPSLGKEYGQPESASMS